MEAAVPALPLSVSVFLLVLGYHLYRVQKDVFAPRSRNLRSIEAASYPMKRAHIRAALALVDGCPMESLWHRD